MSRPDFSREDEALSFGHSLVCGVDEAGRGPWAGPVVAAAVVLDRARIPLGLNDSKKLSHARREALFGAITAHAVGVGIVSAAEIDEINILQATFRAMERAVAALPETPDFALIDGNRAPKLSLPCRTVIAGDALSLSIAAASIIAKVTRDRIMTKLEGQYPGYGFAAHKGYGTAAHMAALTRLGPCTEHRKSFKPIAALASVPGGAAR